MKNKKKIVISSPNEGPEMFIKYLWEDKKRYFGQPWSFTGYALSEDRLFEDRGLIIARHSEILLYRVRDIGVSVSLWQRMFGVGTIRIYSADSSSPVMTLTSIKQPLAVKELLHCYVEKIKDEKGLHIGEYMGL